MPAGIPESYTSDDVVNLAQWLIAEKTPYTNYIHSGMYQKQMVLTAKLHEAQDRNEHLAVANSELHEHLDSLTEAYATLIGDAMSLAEVKAACQPPFPTPIRSGAHRLRPRCVDPRSRSAPARRTTHTSAATPRLRSSKPTLLNSMSQSQMAACLPPVAK